MLVVSHQHQVIGRRRIVAIAPFLIVERDGLNHDPSVRLERRRQLLHETQQIWLHVFGSFLKVHADARELVLFDKLGHRVYQSLPRILVAHGTRQQILLKFFIVKVLQHWQD